MSGRDYRLDLAAVVCTALGLFLLASTVSFDPADRPTEHVYPPNASPSNLCGAAGAWTASWGVELFGIAAIGLGLAPIAVGIELFRRRPALEIVRVLIGLLLAAVGLAALVAPLDLAPGFQTYAGPGGTVGAALAGALAPLLSRVGSWIAFGLLIGAGLVLSAATPIAWMAGRTGRLAWAAARRAGSWIAAATRRRPAAALEDEPDRPNSDAPPSPADAEWDEDEEEDEEDDEEESFEEETIRIVRTGLDDCELPPAPGFVARPAASNVELPDVDILDDPEPFEHHEHEQAIRERARILERTFAEFQMKVRVVQIDTGPVVTQYEIELEPGLRARKVMALADDIAIALKAQNVRIVAPIPGKNTVGVEVPNETRAKVSLKEVMLKAAAASGSMRLPMFLGKDVKGQPMVHDLAAMPHLLIAGRTGTGKSVCLNSLILSMLMTRSPDQVKMLMIDPKMVELSLYRSIPHLLHPVVTDMKKAEAILAWAVEKMEERYALLARAGVRHIDGYNALGLEEIHARLGVESEEEKAQIPAHMPYILIFADEMADLMMTAAKEVEAHIIRLAQKSRAVGIHLVLATQKPTVDVITGLIKSNLPARIAFQVASRTDSRVVLDEMGADKLLGNGDMLFLYPGTSKITRAQGTFVADAEVTRVVEHLSRQAKPQFSEEIVQFATAPRGEAAAGADLSHRDELYEAAVEVVVREQRGSVSLLQRALGIGYGRAARLIDYMAEDGIVGEYQGAQAREVLYAPDQWDELRKNRFARAG